VALLVGAFGKVTLKPTQDQRFQLITILFRWLVSVFCSGTELMFAWLSSYEPPKKLRTGPPKQTGRYWFIFGAMAYFAGLLVAAVELFLNFL
jgi:hypothetical protein